MEEKLLKALVDAAIAHPRTSALVGALYAIALLWKAHPKEKRDAWTKRSPRAVGAIRAVLELAPDPVGFVRVVVFQIVKGLAERASPQPAPIGRVVHDEPGAGMGEAVQLNTDGTPPVRRETQAPPPPSNAGFAVFGVLGAIALATVLAALLSGCAGAQAPNLSPIAPHVIERPEYGVCAETGGKVEIPTAGTVALLTSVCWMRADAGSRDASAIVEPELEPIPDKADAGASE